MGYELVFTVWRQAFRNPFRWINDSYFVGVYGHVFLEWHLIIGWSKPYKNKETS